MEFQNQIEVLSKLKVLADSDIHSIILSGISGSGKTYLAKQFSRMKNIPTFNVISPKVDSLKDLIESSYKLSDNAVICIENLDTGSNSAAQVILKYLEEPLPNIFIVVTAINEDKLPSTILSRAVSVYLPPPTQLDLYEFGRFLNASKFESICSNYQSVFESCCKSFKDVSTLLEYDSDKLLYYATIDTKVLSESLSSSLWELEHYPDNTRSNLVYVFRCLYHLFLRKDFRIADLALNSLLAIESNRLSNSAVVGKFVLNARLSRK